MSTQNNLLVEKFSKRIQKVPQSFLREILKFTSEPGIISFAGGLPNPQLFPITELNHIINKIFKEEAAFVLQYSTTEGYLPLRELIAQQYWEKYQLKILPEEILITSGSQQGLDLIGKILIDENDKVLLEKPSYLGAIQAFSLYQPQFLSINLQPDGPDLTEFEKILSFCPIKLMYAVSDFQNPTGRHWSEEKRKKIGEELSKNNIFIVEDNPYGDINFSNNRIPLIKTYSKDWGILLGSFSKVISPGLRVGWIVANKKIIEKFVIAKQAADLHSGLLPQKMIYLLMKEGLLDTHLNKLISAYKKQKDIMIEEMKKEFPAEAKFEDPSGGMFVWVTLPEYMDSYDLFKKSIEEKVAFVPGKTFYLEEEGRNTLRLNFTNSSEEEIKKGIRILGTIIKRNLK